MNTIKSCFNTLKDTWQNRAQFGEGQRSAQKLDFLPAEVEVL
jgi:hypothetical protein